MLWKQGDNVEFTPAGVMYLSYHYPEIFVAVVEQPRITGSILQLRATDEQTVLAVVRLSDSVTCEVSLTQLPPLLISPSNDSTVPFVATTMDDFAVQLLFGAASNVRLQAVNQSQQPLNPGVQWVLAQMLDLRKTMFMAAAASRHSSRDGEDWKQAADMPELLVAEERAYATALHAVTCWVQQTTGGDCSRRDLDNP